MTSSSPSLGLTLLQPHLKYQLYLTLLKREPGKHGEGPGRVTGQWLQFVSKRRRFCFSEVRSSEPAGAARPNPQRLLSREGRQGATAPPTESPLLEPRSLCALSAAGTVTEGPTAESEVLASMRLLRHHLPSGACWTLAPAPPPTTW